MITVKTQILISWIEMPTLHSEIDELCLLSKHGTTSFFFFYGRLEMNSNAEFKSLLSEPITQIFIIGKCILCFPYERLIFQLYRLLL